MTSIIGHEKVANMKKDHPNPAAFLTGEFKFAKPMTSFGKSICRSIGRGRLLKVTIDTGISADDYDRLVAEIINKDTGPIDSLVFKFKDYLKPDPACTHPNRGMIDRPHVVEHCGWGWYICPPVSTKPVVDAIEAWAAMFE